MEEPRAATVYPGGRLRARVPEGALPARRVGARTRRRRAGLPVVGRAACGARVVPCRGRLDGRARHRGEAGCCPAARAEVAGPGVPGTGAKLVAALRACPMLRFEVTEEASHGNDGERMSYVPGHGVYRAPTSANGDLVVTEQQLRHLAATATSIEAFRHGVDELLGAAWDADLEVYRHAGDGSPITWLHQVV